MADMPDSEEEPGAATALVKKDSTQPDLKKNQSEVSQAPSDK